MQAILQALEGSVGSMLGDWFAAHGASREVEIEARVKDIDPDVFHSIKRKLDSNPVSGCRADCLAWVAAQTRRSLFSHSPAAARFVTFLFVTPPSCTSAGMVIKDHDSDCRHFSCRRHPCYASARGGRGGDHHQAHGGTP